MQMYVMTTPVCGGSRNMEVKPIGQAGQAPRGVKPTLLIELKAQIYKLITL